MPAVYNFKGNEWGWHKFFELVEVVNNIRARQNLKPVSAVELYDHFKAIASRKDINCGGPLWINPTKSLSPQAGILNGNLIDGLEDTYVACGWSNDVIKSVQQGVEYVNSCVRTPLLRGARWDLDFVGQHGQSIKVRL
jgi:hypothetical protein